MNDQQTNSPIRRVEKASEESKQLAATFHEIKSKQLQFLDDAGKSVIERVATFLTVLFAITAFGNTFPPPYLKGNTTAKSLVVITLVLFLLALGSGMLVVLPRPYNYKEDDVGEIKTALQEITKHKAFWLRGAGLLFAAGAIALAALIVSIIIHA